MSDHGPMDALNVQCLDARLGEDGGPRNPGTLGTLGKSTQALRMVIGRHLVICSGQTVGLGALRTTQRGRRGSNAMENPPYSRHLDWPISSRSFLNSTQPPRRYFQPQAPAPFKNQHPWFSGPLFRPDKLQPSPVCVGPK
ncbi:hypothetical protein E4U44_005838 [Claviceps purpurea]|nr:hypothetical protein E4U51_003937 [Claviceps purpurea]KAG6310162.1 hypothetical protein E4U44_005838 [Claviceps purpurea]